MDFKSTSERARLYELVRDADVVVENFRPGVTRRLGIDFDTLKQYNPKLIYASISGFGQHGPLSRNPAYDIVAQAMSGLMSVTGFTETGPTRSGEAIGDLCAGVYAAWAISSALFARERHAPGAQYIDVAMFDVLFSLQMTGLSNLFANGVAPGLVGNRHPISTPFDTYRAADGQVVIAVASNKLFLRFCECLGRPELGNDPRFADDPQRTLNEPALRAEIETWTRQLSVDQVCDILLDAGVPSSPVWNLAQAAESEQAQARQLLIRPEVQFNRWCRNRFSSTVINPIPSLSPRALAQTTRHSDCTNRSLPMNFELDQVELAVVETVEKLAREVIQPRAQHYDETESFCAESLQALAELGGMGINLPEEYGGLGIGSLAMSRVLKPSRALVHRLHRP